MIPTTQVVANKTKLEQDMLIIQENSSLATYDNRNRLDEPHLPFTMPWYGIAQHFNKHLVSRHTGCFFYVNYIKKRRLFFIYII